MNLSQIQTGTHINEPANCTPMRLNAVSNEEQNGAITEQAESLNEDLETLQTNNQGRQYVIDAEGKIIRQECQICHQILPASAFHKNKWHIHGIVGECKTCCCERSRKKYKRDRIEDMVKQMRRRAMGKNIPFDISAEDVREMYKQQEGRCFYTGVPFGDIGHDTTMSIDRVNNQRGYTRDNIVLCCIWVNVMKADYPLEEFLSRIKAIANRIPKIVANSPTLDHINAPHYGSNGYGIKTLFGSRRDKPDPAKNGEPR